MAAACETLEERIAANKARPCAKAFRPVFSEAIAPYVAPGILWLGMTIIGYGLSTGREWATSSFIKPSTQMSVMLLLMVADHASSYWDHSRVSEEENCLTALVTSRTLDETTGRLVFGGLGALLTAASAYGVSTGSITLAATSVPFAAIMLYLCWSPENFQSCKANAMVTGGLAFGLDIMTFVGIMETLQALSGSQGGKDTSWHGPTVLYSVVISCLFVVLFGWHSDYGKRIKPGSCAIDDDGDAAAEKLRDRKPELYTGILMSATSIAYFVYLKLRFSEVSCCSVYPALMFLVFDVLTKLQVWKRGESLVGDAAHRSFVYVTVQVMDILLSSSSLISVMSEKSLLGVGSGGSRGSRGLLAHSLHLAGGSITYVWSVLRLAYAMVTRGGREVATSSIKRLAEVVKLVGLNIVANLVPLAIDQKNMTYMANASPQNDLNVPCHVD